MTAIPNLAEREREFAFHQQDHAAIARLAYDEAGILLPEGKAQLVYGRLARRVRARGLTDFASYIALLDHDREERGHAIDSLTTNHTSFFREKHHFEHFMETAWPQLSANLACKGRVRIWSAACSSGEEPYTLLLAILGKDEQAAKQLARQDFRVLATDLSDAVVAAAKAGRYARDIVETIPADLRAKWLVAHDREAEVRQELRDLIAFRKLNLLGDWPMRQRFDAIFCRNVMIYFDESTKARLQARLVDSLEPGGFLYIGHSERIAPEVSKRLICVGRTTFQKVEE